MAIIITDILLNKTVTTRHPDDQQKNKKHSILPDYAKKALPLQPQSSAPVAKLVDAPDLGSGNSGCVGSSPIRRTI